MKAVLLMLLCVCGCASYSAWKEQQVKKDAIMHSPMTIEYVDAVLQDCELGVTTLDEFMSKWGKIGDAAPPRDDEEGYFVDTGDSYDAKGYSSKTVWISRILTDYDNAGETERLYGLTFENDILTSIYTPE